MYPIYNFHEQLRSDLRFNKFEVKNLLFIEYNCPLEDETVKIWSEFDYIIHVLSGKKTWKTLQDECLVQAGETLYIKKGANILKQSFEENFCMLGFFLSDDIIRNTIREIKTRLVVQENVNESNTNIVRLSSIPNLDSFYQSMLSYFRYPDAPISGILELKAKELLMNIISAGNQPGLITYFNRVAYNNELTLPSKMEENYSYNLKLEEFATLCNRSLSSFKRDFKAYYGTTPGKWLLKKRLELAAHLLVSTQDSVSEIAYDSGFEDLSHFSKSFRVEYGTTPNSFRK